MAEAPRLTGPTRAVLAVLLARPAAEHFGSAIGAAAGLASGTVHPMLARLEALGWLTSRWEDVDPRREGRPPRRYYRLTPSGEDGALAALARAARDARSPGSGRSATTAAPGRARPLPGATA